MRRTALFSLLLLLAIAITITWSPSETEGKKSAKRKKKKKSNKKKTTKHKATSAPPTHNPTHHPTQAPIQVFPITQQQCFGFIAGVNATWAYTDGLQQTVYRASAVPGANEWANFFPPVATRFVAANSTTPFAWRVYVEKNPPNTFMNIQFNGLLTPYNGDGPGWFTYWSTGYIVGKTLGTPILNLSTWQQGDIVGVNKTKDGNVEFHVNGVVQASIPLNLTGSYYPEISTMVVEDSTVEQRFVCSFS